MADVNVGSKQREFKHECKEFAANASCSVVLVVVALILLRPLMVGQILSRADAYSAVGQFEESKRQCDKALLIDNESSRAWHQQARLCNTLGNRELAYRAYQKATQAGSTNWQAHYEVGMMYVDDELYHLAVPYFERVRKTAGERKDVQASCHRNVLDMLALCYEKVGDFGKMEFTLEEMRIFYPGHGNAEARLAELKGNRATRQ